jgi:transcriptional regulator with XRE-family HTH domain
MSASIFLEYDCEDIAAAMSVALLQFRNANGLTLAKIAKQCEREAQSISQYCNGTAEISSTVWLKLTAKWPELEDRLIYNLDEAEKAFRAKQRELRLNQ